MVSESLKLNQQFNWLLE